MREKFADCGKMILGSDSHTRYGALGTMAICEGGGELAKQLLGRTYDVAGLGVGAVCPTKSLTMVPQEQEAAQQDAFDYCVAKVSEKEDMVSVNSVKDSQFKKPLLEFSGSCAGCAETSYARLITQLFGEKMFISNATGCSSIWGGTASIRPYTTNKASGHGPAWISSRRLSRCVLPRLLRKLRNWSVLLLSDIRCTPLL